MFKAVFKFFIFPCPFSYTNIVGRGFLVVFKGRQFSGKVNAGQKRIGHLLSYIIFMHLGSFKFLSYATNDIRH